MAIMHIESSRVRGFDTHCSLGISEFSFAIDLRNGVDSVTFTLTGRARSFFDFLSSLAQRACCRIALKSSPGCSFFGSFSFRWVRLGCIPALTDLVARLRLSNILSPHVIVIIIAVLLLATVVGCGQSEAQSGLPSDLAIPETFKVNGQLWTHRHLITADDDAFLAEYLELHPEYKDSPQLTGTPELFSSGSSDLRFYWLQSNGDAATWTCVSSEDGSFQMSEGIGSPFFE